MPPESTISAKNEQKKSDWFKGIYLQPKVYYNSDH